MLIVHTMPIKGEAVDSPFSYTEEARNEWEEQTGLSFDEVRNDTAGVNPIRKAVSDFVSGQNIVLLLLAGVGVVKLLKGGK